MSLVTEALMCVPSMAPMQSYFIRNTRQQDKFHVPLILWKRNRDNVEPHTLKYGSHLGFPKILVGVDEDGGLINSFHSSPTA